jgi:hypothetical protein
MFYPNQQSVAQDICHYFQQEGGRYGLLYAYPQVGKSGTYNLIIMEMKRLFPELSGMVLSGCNEKLLKEQAKRDVQFYGNRDTTVFFRQDLLKLDRTSVSNKIIIVDESHLDQSTGQTMDRFYRKIGIHPSMSDAEFRERNLYIVSISATPFSEKIHLSSKRIFHLLPGEGYQGLSQFWKRGCIHAIPTNLATIPNILKTFGKKYHLLRMISPKYHKQVMDVCKKRDFDIYRYDSTRKSIRIDHDDDPDTDLPCLSEEPKKPSIIIIKGRLRVGKVLPYKQYIGTVWEFSENPKTDTIIQGLFGRCCGYHSYDIHMYCSDSLFRLHPITHKTDFDMYIDDGMVDRAMNIVPQPSSKKRKFEGGDEEPPVLTIPLTWNIPMNKDAFGAYTTPHGLALETISSKTNRSAETFLPNLLEMIAESSYQKIRDAGSLTEMQKKEIIEWFSSSDDQARREGSSVRMLNTRNKGYALSFQKIKTSLELQLPPDSIDFTKRRTSKNIRTPLFMVAFVCTEDMEHIPHGTVFVIFKTRNRNPTITYTPKTTGKEIFAPHNYRGGGSGHVTTTEEQYSTIQSVGILLQYFQKTGSSTDRIEWQEFEAFIHEMMPPSLTFHSTEYWKKMVETIFHITFDENEIGYGIKRILFHL